MADLLGPLRGLWQIGRLDLSVAGEVFTGLDCGGTRTRAVAIYRNEEVLFEAESGPANWASTPRQVITHHLAEALNGAPEATAVCACFAGLLTDLDRNEAAELVQALAPSAKVRIEPDYAGAWAACPVGTTACVIAGTGSLVCSSYEGRIVKSGGGGPLYGDHGSAYGLVREAIGLMLEVPIIEPQGEFQRAIKDRFGGDTFQETVAMLYQNRPDAGTLAAFAPSIVLDWDNNVPYAVECIQSEMSRLAGTVAAHLAAFALRVRSPQLALSGGLWKISSRLASELERHLQRSGIEANIGLLDVPPVIGAARLALEAS